jgi:hypothetical protein
MRRIVMLVAVVGLTACGGSDGPAAVVAPPVVTAIAAVRADSAVWNRDSVTFTARNVGRAAQWRISAWGDVAPCPIGTPNNVGCDPQQLCAGAGALINASARIRLTMTCANRNNINWAVIETQDPGSPAWQRTACLSRVGPCPARIQPER